MIDRQNTLRSLPSQEHDWIMATLPNIPDVRFQRVHMEEHDFAAQLAIARGTDVMLGVHGKGLTHQLAMRPGRFVIEYFPASNSFLFDIVSRRGNPRVHEVLHRSPCSPPTITPPPHCSTLPPPPIPDLSTFSHARWGTSTCRSWVASPWLHRSSRSRPPRRWTLTASSAGHSSVPGATCPRGTLPIGANMRAIQRGQRCWGQLRRHARSCCRAGAACAKRPLTSASRSDACQRAGTAVGRAGCLRGKSRSAPTLTQETGGGSGMCAGVTEMEVLPGSVPKLFLIVASRVPREKITNENEDISTATTGAGLVSCGKMHGGSKPRLAIRGSDRASLICPARHFAVAVLLPEARRYRPCENVFGS
mmetsp:Transcript_35252/g.94376  ORF Transcript_35252/g.94376 Transcript_35252/m.94376 type:complete len:363 (+) Transcript_35252:243-1331(+)